MRARLAICAKVCAQDFNVERLNEKEDAIALAQQDGTGRPRVERQKAGREMQGPSGKPAPRWPRQGCGSSARRRRRFRTAP